MEKEIENFNNNSKFIRISSDGKWCLKLDALDFSYHTHDVAQILSLELRKAGGLCFRIELKRKLKVTK